MRVVRCVAASVAMILGGCASAPPAPLLRAPPTVYLLGIDQLVSPDFSLDMTPHALSVAGVVTEQGASSDVLGSAGFSGGAAEDFFRSVTDLSQLNGPVQIGDTVEEFGTSGGAAQAYASDVKRLDAVAGSTALSTGSLGDAAHATTRIASLPDGTGVLQLTVEWRVANILDVLVVRGRVGGLRSDDALILAHRQTVSELGLPTGAAASALTG